MLTKKQLEPGSTVMDSLKWQHQKKSALSADIINDQAEKDTIFCWHICESEPHDKSTTACDRLWVRPRQQAEGLRRGQEYGNGAVTWSRTEGQLQLRPYGGMEIHDDDDDYDYYYYYKRLIVWDCQTVFRTWLRWFVRFPQLLQWAEVISTVVVDVRTSSTSCLKHKTSEHRW